MSAPETTDWRADNSAKCYDLALGVLAKELAISRKALAAIAGRDRPSTCRLIAQRALDEIQEVRRNG